MLGDIRKKLFRRRRPVGKIEEAQNILKEMGLPRSQQNEISALTLLALCGIGEDDTWQEATRKSHGVSKGIMTIIEQKYGKKYAANTRETVRRQVLHQFVQAHIVDYNPDNPRLPTNSPRAHYALAHDALTAIRTYGTDKWEAERKTFLAAHGSLRDKYGGRKAKDLVPVRLPDGKTLALSPGKHNVIQAAVVEQFIPRFAPGSRLLYLGDTADKNLLLDTKGLADLGIPITKHDKLPDVVFYDPNKERLFLVEVVTSHGPMSPKRFYELEEMLSECKVKAIFVSAFPDFKEFREHMEKIAWETEVWVAETPDHMIHYDGEKFLAL
jgi:type II restriction enzyme